MSLLKANAHYKRYFAGESEQRPDNLPPFEYTDENTVHIMPGEVFCRYGNRGDTQLACLQYKRFANENVLREHVVKVHNASVNRYKAGRRSMLELVKARDFYKSLETLPHSGAHVPTPATQSTVESPPTASATSRHCQRVSVDDDDDTACSDGDASGGGDTSADDMATSVSAGCVLVQPNSQHMAAPSPRPVSPVVPPEAAPVEAVELHLLPVTVAKSNKASHPKVAAMRSQLGLSQRHVCESCAAIERQCPGLRRPQNPTCEVWDHFAVHDVEHM